MNQEQNEDKAQPQVIYIEQDRGVGASWRRTRHKVRQAGRRWVENSVDADLPPQVDEAIPDWARGAKGRVRLAVIAALVMIAWIVALLWLIG